MSDTGLTPAGGADVPEVVRTALARTPARLLVGRAGPGYRTGTWLKLREDHAAARDAVHAELDLHAAFGPERIDRFRLAWMHTQAQSKAEYLLRPDLGRRLDRESRQRLLAGYPPGADLQIAIGDGLSATAVAAQAPALLDGLAQEAEAHGWRFGRPVVVRYCRVGVLNDIGELLSPAVVVLLIGERPGLATAESLSAYLAYRPRPGQTDADRNLVANIHPRGVPATEAVARVAAYAARLMAAGAGGVAVKEEWPPALPG